MQTLNTIYIAGRKRRGQADKIAARSVNWQRTHPELLAQRIRAAALGQQRQAAVAAAVKSEVGRRVQAATISCCLCGARTHLSQRTVQVELVHIEGTVVVQLPAYSCSGSACQSVDDPQPTDLGYFPATPSKASIWYDEQMLVLVSELKLRSAASFTSLSSSFARLHDSNSLSSRPAVWEHLQEACIQWLKVEEQLCSPATYGVWL